jgi:RimJ/RimL family protein N-acetyltransferase
MSYPTVPTIYRIETPRLVLRCWEPKDAPLLKATMDENIEHLKPWMPWAAEYPKELPEMVAMLRGFRARFDSGEDFIYGIFDRAETRALGGTGLHTRIGSQAREIGYWVDHRFTGQGYATETAAALTQVSFSVLQMERVEIHCAVENLPSAAIPPKLGYTLDAVLRKRIFLLDGRFHDSMVWSILREEYPASYSAGLPVRSYDALGQPLG